MNFDGGRLGIEEYPAEYYKELLEYIKDRDEVQYWHLLPWDLVCLNLRMKNGIVRIVNELEE